jgi:hypothetical protein
LKDFSGSNSTTLNSIGIAEDQPVQLSVGAHSLVATYAGDNSFNGSTSPAESVTITTAPTVTTITTAPATAISTTTAVTITAKVTTQSSGVGPTGSVIFKVNGTQVGNAVAVVSTPASGLNSGSLVPAFATATITQTFPTPGSEAITATYTSGDNNYSGSAGSGNITVTASGTVPTTTVVTASSTTITSGASVTLNATVTGSTNNGPGVTGTVQFMNGTQALGSPVNCTPTAGTTTTQGTCKATLSTALSNVPPVFLNPSRTPRIPPAVPLILATCVLALLLIVSMRRNGIPVRRRLAYACTLVMIGIAAGFAGCGGGSSSSGGGGGGTATTHVDSITAVYGGDSTYVGSTSVAVAVTVSTQ